jgi:predicted metal-dependent hydrolase
MKNMYIRVLPPDGRVRISAPRRTPDAVLRSFAAARLEWIHKHLHNLQARPRPAARQFVSGEIHQVWGRPCRLEVLPASGRGRVSLAGDSLIIQAPADSGAEKRAGLLNDWYRAELRQAAPALLEKWQQVVGVRAAEWRSRNMRTRWGSCNPRRKRIWLNLQLAAKPPECLEYVIVHELVHLLEIRHNDRFHGFMDKFYPNWRNVRQRLNGRAPGQI